MLVLLAEGEQRRPNDLQVKAVLRRVVQLKSGPKFSRLYVDRFLLFNFFECVSSFVSDGVIEGRKEGKTCKRFGAA